MNQWAIELMTQFCSEYVHLLATAGREVKKEDDCDLECFRASHSQCLSVS